MKAATMMMAIALVATPAFGMTYDVSITDLSVTGTSAVLYNSGFSIGNAGLISGTIVEDGGAITFGELAGNLAFDITVVVPGMGSFPGSVPMSRTVELMADGHPLASPLFDNTMGYHQYDPEQFPIPVTPGDPMPPLSTMLGADGYDSTSLPIGSIAVGVMVLDMTDIVSITAIEGGQEIVYGVSGAVQLDVTPAGQGLINTSSGFSGTMTVVTTPEPASALLLLCVAPLLRRRR